MRRLRARACRSLGLTTVRHPLRRRTWHGAQLPPAPWRTLLIPAHTVVRRSNRTRDLLSGCLVPLHQVWSTSSLSFPDSDWTEAKGERRKLMERLLARKVREDDGFKTSGARGPALGLESSSFTIAWKQQRVSPLPRLQRGTVPGPGGLLGVQDVDANASAVQEVQDRELGSRRCPVVLLNPSATHAIVTWMPPRAQRLHIGKAKSKTYAMAANLALAAAMRENVSLPVSRLSLTLLG